MHLAAAFELPESYRARPYAGPADHRAMAHILNEHRTRMGQLEMVTPEELDLRYSHFVDCDPDLDIAIIETVDTAIAYSRASREDLDAGTRDLVIFSPTLTRHTSEDLFVAEVEGQERHMTKWTDAPSVRYRGDAAHPGPDEAPTGEAAWFESLGYEPTEWGAFLIRPHLDDVPDRQLPEGVEIRPVADDHIDTIWHAETEAFRDEWDSREPNEDDYREYVESPHFDPSMWKVAWAGDVVVGQVRSYINRDENASRSCLRGYTEHISTHRDWRNRGIAAALLAASLVEVRDRGMTQAALGADTNNPGGAFHLYTSLGFEPQSFEAVYTKPAIG